MTGSKVNPLVLAAWRLFNQAAVLRSPDLYRQAADAFRAAGMSRNAETADRAADYYEGKKVKK